MPKPTGAAFVVYIPALHRGYLELFNRYPDIDSIYVLGASILELEDYLRKDLRALRPQQQVEVLSGLRRFKHVAIVELDELDTLSLKYARIVLPDEDIGRAIAAKLRKGTYEFSPVFLRWDRRAVNAQDPVQPDRTISWDVFDHEIMKQANAASATSSNIWRRVGAALVKDGKVLSKSSNRHMPTDFSPWIDGDPRSIAKRGVAMDITTDMHAEARLIANAAREGVVLKNASIYVTNFPCPHCAKLIAESGIKRCFYSAGYAVLDGQQLLNAYGVELIHVDEPENAGHPAEWIPYKK